MSLDDEYPVKISFNRVCPECGVGNTADAENCIVCDKDLTETVLFLEDEFYDLEVTESYCGAQEKFLQDKTYR